VASEAKPVQFRHNGESSIVPAGTTIAALIAGLGINPRYVAVEVNQSVLPRELHAATPIVEGDAIEIVTMVGGG